MAKKITIYVPDELSLYTGREIVQLAKKGLSDTDNVSVPLSSQNRDYSSNGDDCKSRQDDLIFTMLEKIYSDTQIIVEAVEKKSKEQKIKSNLMKGDTIPVGRKTPDWLINLSNDRYEHYIKMFDNDKGRGTGDRDIRSTFVKDVGENSVNKELWTRLIQYVLESGVDWTEYIPEELEPTLYYNNK